MIDGTAVCGRLSSRRRASLIIALAVLCLHGCQPAARDFDRIGPGQSRSQVKELLGEPDRIRSDTLPQGAFFGPQEALTSQLAAGDPYEEWVYLEGETEFYVWFAGGAEDPESWQVVTTARASSGAVY